MTQSMYQDYFGITENPFSIIPDPHYLFMSQRHQEALAHLLYGVSESGGFVLLTGEVGTGKTTICRTLMEQLPENTDLALILNPKLTEMELMAAICDEMRISYPIKTSSLKDFFDFMTRHLLKAHANGRNPVLMIDEAQTLSSNVLELVRLLTNLETAEKKLLQIILVGQPELNHTLSLPENRQTAQRITARYHLTPLGLVETRAYVEHRLKVAGLDQRIFTNRAIKSVHKSSRGIPRLINSICDRALLAAYVEGKKQIDRKLAQRSSEEVLGTVGLPSGKSVWGSFALVAGLTGLVLLAGFDPYRWGVQDRLSQLIEPLMPPSAPEAEPAPQTTVTEQKPETRAELAQTEPEQEIEAEAKGEAEPSPDTEAAAKESGPEPLSASAVPEPEDLRETAPIEVEEEATEAATAVDGEPAISPDTMPEAIMPDGSPPPPGMDDATGQNVKGMADGGAPIFEDDEKIDISKAEGTLIGDLIKAGTPDRAFVQLFNLWQQDYLNLAGLTPCDKAATAALSCLQGETGIEGLKAINRPVVVSFMMPDGERLYGVISTIENDFVGESVTIDFGDRAVSMRTQAFGLRWPGDYLVLWKPADIIKRPLVFGQQGQDVVELRRLLAKAGYADGEKDLEGQGSVFFGPSLREKLRLFQQDSGLKPDGIAGPETLMRITGKAGETFGASIHQAGE